MGNPVNIHWCSLFKKGPRVEGSSLTNPKKASVDWLFRQVQIGILASQTVSLTLLPCGLIFQKGLSSTPYLQKIHTSNLRKADEGKENIRCLVPDDPFVFSECTCFCPPWTSLPPSLLKSLTFSTAVLVLILFIVVIIGVQDRSVRVGVIGLVFPLAFVLWGTEGLWRLSHQPRSQELRRCLPQLVFGCEAVKGTDMGVVWSSEQPSRVMPTRETEL